MPLGTEKASLLAAAGAGRSADEVEYLVIAGGGGGGGGGNQRGGGGGAGGMQTGTMTVTAQTYSITVGAGGAGNSSGGIGSNGSNSVFSSVTSTAGGGGGYSNSNGLSGGSGGGGGGKGGDWVGGSGGAGTSGQGYRGGSGTLGAGGGGGKSEVGNDGGMPAGWHSFGGAGGDGIANSITGSSVFYAGGGGGGSNDGGINAAGGAGGGGAGGAYKCCGSSCSVGTANTGGGGGGAGGTDGPQNNGCNGGSGVVIIAYTDGFSDLSAVGSGLTCNGSTGNTTPDTTRSGYKVYKFTAGTGDITFQGNNMKYVKGNVFPYTEEQLRKDNPNTSFPINALSNESVRVQYGVEEVSETAIPIKKGYKAVQGEIGIADGKKVETWDLILKDVEELSFDEITQVEATPPEGYLQKDGVPELVGEEWKQTWVYEEASGLRARTISYGPPEKQIEFITENGLEAWQAKVSEIKARYPKV